MTNTTTHPVLANLERDGLLTVLPLQPAVQIDKDWDPEDMHSTSFHSFGWAATYMACAGTTYDEPLHRDPTVDEDDD